MPTTEHAPAVVRTPEDTAVRLLTTPRTLERWRAIGAGPRYVKLGRRVAYRDCDIDAYVAAQVRTHTGQTVRDSAPTRDSGTRR